MAQDTATPSTTDLAGRAAAQLPRLQEELARLVAIPSVSAPGYPEETHEKLLEARAAIVELFEGAGVQNIGTVDLPDTAPVITGEIPAPPGAPTVLLYSHYDVVPAGDEAAWDSPPFEATERDGAIYGRGTADTKSNILVHVGALRAWEGKPPVGIKLLIEGQEEVGSPLEDPAKLGPFAADVLVIGDGGNIRPGEPSLTVSIRGDTALNVEARTLEGPRHSGNYGGAAPDALLALVRALASLHDDAGDVAVAGLRREEWTGAVEDEAVFREAAGVLDGVPLIGSGGLGARQFTGPAITVTGIDAPSVDNAMNAVSPHARARLNVRLHPEQPAAEAQAAVIRHLEGLRPFGIQLTCTPGDNGDGFRGKTEGPAWEAMNEAMREAWGAETVQIATGGAIPLVKALSDAAPEATVLLFGTTDKFASIHGPNERVLVDELEKAVVAETLFFQKLADAWEGAR
jgi:acetylornithine deacetylase/succinyl-diaminopimelate desuccinylase-like protein